MMATTTNTIIENLYKLYAPQIDGKLRYRYGDKLVIDFQMGGVTPEDIDTAHTFAEGLRKQIDNAEATIEQRNSRVIIQPHLL